MRVALFIFLCAASASAQPARGGLWSAVGTDDNVWALTTAPDGDVYAGGRFRTVAGDSTGAVARWDGTMWRAMGALDGEVWAVAAGEGGDVVAAGYLENLVPDETVCTVRWDGAAWTPLGTTCAELDEIYAATLLADGSPVVGGRDYNPTGSGVVRWDGVAWTDLGTGPTGRLRGNVWALAAGPDGVLYAGGEFLDAGSGTFDGCVARWDGTGWETLSPNLRSASGFGDCVLSLDVGPDGTLYAGGYFMVDDATETQGVARWDGTSWTALPNDFPEGGVWDLAVAADGLLYAGHYYEPGLTVWDGIAWHRVGDGPPFGGAVFALAADGAGGLFVGGGFPGIGGVDSPNLARYTVPPVATEPSPEALSFTLGPNPTAGAVRVFAPRAGRVDVLDTQGRTVRTLDVNAGEATLPTDGLAPGLYLVRLTAGADVATRTLVVNR